MTCEHPGPGGQICCRSKGHKDPHYDRFCWPNEDSSPVDLMKYQIDTDGIGEAIVDFYGRDLAKSFPGERIPVQLCGAWRRAYDAMAIVTALVEEFAGE